MKKVLYLIILMFLTLNSFAQNEVGKISIEPQIGFNVSNLTKASLNSKTGSWDKSWSEDN